jgi:hypothetical protein
MFVQHEPCSKCGSRDNFARYDDGGGFCFGCHYHERATHTPSRHMGGTTDESIKWQERAVKPLPEDLNHEFSKEAVEWLSRFHVDVPTALRNGLEFSPSRNALVFKLGPQLWQARHFSGWWFDKFGKCYTSGDVNECLFVFEGNSENHFGNGGQDIPEESSKERSNELVIVEDPVSALRVGTLRPSMPLLGSHLATSRLNAIARWYDGLVVWLDSDKYKEAQGIAERARLLGLSTRVIWTEQDPKCYTNEQLMEYLND